MEVKHVEYFGIVMFVFAGAELGLLYQSSSRRVVGRTESASQFWWRPGPETEENQQLSHHWDVQEFLYLYILIFLKKIPENPHQL